MIAWTVFVGASLGCGGAAVPRDAADGTAERVTTATGGIGGETDSHPEPTPTTHADDSSLDSDIALVVGGNLSVDHVGLDALGALLARLEARAADFVTRFEALYFVRADPSMAPIPAQVRSQVLLGYLYPHATEQVRRVAARHRRIDQESLRDGAYDERSRERVQRRAEELALLADGIDVPIGASWTPVTPDTWCIDSAPPTGDALLRVGVSCTCGEALACATALEGSRVVVHVRTDPTSSGVCLDCYPTHAGCRLPALPPNARVPVVAGGRTLGTLQTAMNGRATNAPRCAFGVADAAAGLDDDRVAFVVERSQIDSTAGI